MAKPVKKFALFPEAYDEVSLVDEGAAGSAHVLIMKRKSASNAYDNGGRTKAKKEKKSSGRSQTNPCSTKTNSTGAKDGGKSSDRGANWQEGRHARDEGGKFGQTSGKSKSKYGKGGTTKTKLDRACRDNTKGGTKSEGKQRVFQTPQERKNRNKGAKNAYKNKGRGNVRKSSLSTWDRDAHVMEIMERKPTHGR